MMKFTFLTLDYPVFPIHVLENLGAVGLVGFDKVPAFTLASVLCWGVNVDSALEGELGGGFHFFLITGRGESFSYHKT